MAKDRLAILRLARKASRAARDLETAAFESDAITTAEYRAILRAQSAVRRAVSPITKEYR